jgi:hypothetical protein
MFKIMVIGLLFAVTMGTIAPLNAAPLHDVQMGFKTDVPYGWTSIVPATASVTRRIFLIPKIATVSVGVYHFDTVPTPGIIENIQISEHYDGWITLFRRDLNPTELRRANADMGEIVAYGHNRLEPNNTLSKRVVVEYYFTQKNSGYFVSINTTESDWKTAESSFKSFIRMFMLN